MSTYQYISQPNETEIAEMLQLQQDNLERNVTQEEVINQGFVTVEHSPELMHALCQSAPQIVVKFDNKVVGYALVMLAEFKDKIPILFPMFEMINQLRYKGQPVSGFSYFIMGQICIAKAHRGKGLFDGLYQNMKKYCAKDYDLVITEVASRNQRSFRAHQRVGFKNLNTYNSDKGESWELIYWNWL